MFFCLAFALPLGVYVCVCIVVACWGGGGVGAGLLASLVVSSCGFVTFPMVSWVRCGT